MARMAVGRPIVGSEVSLSHASEAFQLRCQAQNLSPLTCDWYKRRLKRFARFLDEHGVTLAREITPYLLRLDFDA